MKKYLPAVAFICVAYAYAKPPCIDGLRAPSQPFISGDGFRSIANHVYDNTDSSLIPEEIAFADMLFVKTDRLEQFFRDLYPHIQTPFILITHNSDMGAPDNYMHYLEEEKILQWYGQNPTIHRHQKFIAIPIGINNRYIDDFGNIHNFFKFYAYQATRSIKKDHLVGINFHVSTFKEREAIFNLFASQDYCVNIFANTHYEYLIKMSHAQYILSPRGNGLDCHRTWEAIIVGSIPIVKTSDLDELFEGLPIIIVQDWADINRQFLEERYEGLQAKLNPITTQKITYGYWEQKLLDAQKQFRLKNRSVTN